MVWSADFKGQFRTGDGRLCYPLTIKEATATPPKRDIKEQQETFDEFVRGELVYLSGALAGEAVALKQQEEHLWGIWFSSYCLGVLNELTDRITPLLIKQGGRDKG